MFRNTKKRSLVRLRVGGSSPYPTIVSLSVPLLVFECHGLLCPAFSRLHTKDPLGTYVGLEGALMGRIAARSRTLSHGARGSEAQNDISEAMGTRPALMTSSRLS